MNAKQELELIERITKLENDITKLNNKLTIFMYKNRKEEIKLTENKIVKMFSQVNKVNKGKRNG